MELQLTQEELLCVEEALEWKVSHYNLQRSRIIGIDDYEKEIADFDQAIKQLKAVLVKIDDVVVPHVTCTTELVPALWNDSVLPPA